MKTEDIDEAILASLKKLGPSAPRRLADDAGIDPGAVTYAGVRLRKAKLIQTAGSTANRIWALPEQKIEMADLVPATKKKRTARKVKAAPARKKADKRKVRKGATRAQARKAIERKLRRTERRTIERPAGVTRPVFSREARAPLALAIDGTFSRLRIGLEEHLAAVTDARQRLFGATLPTLAAAS